MISFKRRSGIVNLVDGTALAGKLCLAWPWQVRLIETTLIGRDGTRTRVDGRVRVPCSRVLFVQVTD